MAYATLRLSRVGPAQPARVRLIRRARDPGKRRSSAQIWGVGGAAAHSVRRVLHAKDGVDAQLYHLQHALDYAVAHIPDDAQTVALVARVHAIRNGHTSVDAVLESRRR